MHDEAPRSHGDDEVAQATEWLDHGGHASEQRFVLEQRP